MGLCHSTDHTPVSRKTFHLQHEASHSKGGTKVDRAQNERMEK